MCIVKFFAVLQAIVAEDPRLLRKNREMPFVYLATFVGLTIPNRHIGSIA
ncbi:MAG: hypothetical protein ACLUAY_09275 [Butyricicoccus sp.]